MKTLREFWFGILLKIPFTRTHKQWKCFLGSYGKSGYYIRTCQYCGRVFPHEKKAELCFDCTIEELTMLRDDNSEEYVRDRIRQRGTNLSEKEE